MTASVSSRRDGVQYLYLLAAFVVVVAGMRAAESILNPFAKITAGYQPVMPPFQGLLKDREVDALIAFIKSLK